MEEEKRQHARYRLRWNAALRGDQGGVSYGETLDMSRAGVSVLIDHNLPAGTQVTLYLQIPPKQRGQNLVIEVRARVLYAAFSAPHDRWRAGLQFLRFAEGSKDLFEKELRQFG